MFALGHELINYQRNQNSKEQHYYRHWNFIEAFFCPKSLNLNTREWKLDLFLFKFENQLSKFNLQLALELKTVNKVEPKLQCVQQVASEPRIHHAWFVWSINREWSLILDPHGLSSRQFNVDGASYGWGQIRVFCIFIHVCVLYVIHQKDKISIVIISCFGHGKPDSKEGSYESVFLSATGRQCFQSCLSVCTSTGFVSLGTPCGSGLTPTSTTQVNPDLTPTPTTQGPRGVAVPPATHRPSPTHLTLALTPYHVQSCSSGTCQLEIGRLTFDWKAFLLYCTFSSGVESYLLHS